ncbi:MAG: DUF262 domain-containing protein [Leptospiraceae bacterium]|nr:DUF262 domain-containing protein [Leptospiraceae bacterium]
METSNKSFWELIQNYKINIPIIQRDYAQGREEESEKREKFLSNIFRTLSEKQPLDLDFIYGRIKDGTFYPIDGQQRLTTLFLIHWYTAIKENVDNEKKDILKKFIYDTRISSREFCKALIEEQITIPQLSTDNNFILEIQNKYWFRVTWKNDPTIKAMLVMIQALHEKFNSMSNDSIWDKLISDRQITFQVLDLGAKGFELTDELYIKMNARGKQLTPFENFKANFIQFLDKNYSSKKLKHPIKGDISYSGYFSYKIEKEWTDLFWAYRNDKATIDIEFSKYFSFIAQLSFFKNANRKVEVAEFTNSFVQYEEIFTDEDSLLFLFNSLDKLYEIFNNKNSPNKKNIGDFFNSLFNNDPLQNINTEKITLFWNNIEDINLFEMIIKEGKNDEVRNKMFLYCILHYLIVHNLSESNDGLKKYIRVLRNLFQATRQTKNTKYETNIRLNNFGSYWLLFKQLATTNVYGTLQNQSLVISGSQITDKNIANEKEKAELILNSPVLANDLYGLEEFKYLGGMVHQLKPTESSNKLKEIFISINEIWNDSVPDGLKIQALIANGFEGLEIKWSNMGETYYFGRNGNWETILTSEDEKISNSILSLLHSFKEITGSSPENKLKSIVIKWLKENPLNRSWKYYFLKYPEFISDKNYYAWINDFEIRMLRNDGASPLLGMHINPYVFTICKKINDKNICDESECCKQYTGNSPLRLKNGLTLTSTENGWIIGNEVNILTNNIKTEFNLALNEDKYILRDTKDRDRVEIAIDFINRLQSL